MARIDGKWIGQVVIDFDMDDLGSDQYFIDWKDAVISSHITDLLRRMIGSHICWPGMTSVDVKKLHAYLRRDEPIEWAKEEVVDGQRLP